MPSCVQQGNRISTEPVLQELVNEDPVHIAPADEQDFAVAGSLIDTYALHDALLIANHRVRGTEAVISKDEEFADESTIWR